MTIFSLTLFYLNIDYSEGLYSEQIDSWKCRNNCFNEIVWSLWREAFESHSHCTSSIIVLILESGQTGRILNFKAWTIFKVSSSTTKICIEIWMIRITVVVVDTNFTHVITHIEWDNAENVIILENIFPSIWTLGWIDWPIQLRLSESTNVRSGVGWIQPEVCLAFSIWHTSFACSNVVPHTQLTICDVHTTSIRWVKTSIDLGDDWNIWKGTTSLLDTVTPLSIPVGNA